MNKSFIYFSISVIQFSMLTFNSFGWGSGHRWITESAIEVLPEWQQKIIGKERKRLERRYSSYPDFYNSNRKEISPYIMPSLRKGLESNRTTLHMDTTPKLNLELFDYYVKRIIKDLKNPVTHIDGIRFMGTFCHSIQDRVCPAHSFPEDIYWEDMKQFLPPANGRSKIWDKCGFFNACKPFEISGYKPRLLGENADEIAFRLQTELSTHSLLKARKGYISFLKALYGGDRKGVKQYRQQCAENAARNIADMIGSILVLSSGTRIPRAKTAPLKSISFLDLPQLNNYDPDKQWAQRLTHHFWGMHWHRSNYYGMLIKNTAGGFPYPKKKQRPLSLKMKDDKEITKGFVQNSDYGHVFLVPPGVFSHLEATIGQQSDMENEAEYRFIIKSKGEKLYESDIIQKRGEPMRISVPLKKNIDRISLNVRKTNNNSSSTIHAVWGNPVLLK